METELSGGIYNIISLSNAHQSGLVVSGMSGRIIGNDTSGNIDISNSGRVVSESGRAIEFEGGSRRTLDLYAPAFIGGTMVLGGSANVNITTGRSHSVLWTFDGELEGGAPNVSGKVPYFYNPDTKTFATIDPTVFAAAYSTLTNMTGMLSGVVQRRIDGGGGAGAGQVASLSNPDTYAAVLEKAPGEEASAVAVPTADVPAAEPGSALWMAVTGAPPTKMATTF